MLWKSTTQTDGYWKEIHYTQRTEFITYFEKYKLNKAKENTSKLAISKYKTEEHGQNPIEWLNVLAKDEKNNDTELHSHKTASIKTCIIKLKDQSMRLHKDAIKAVYDDCPNTLSPPLTISSYPMMTLRTYKSLKRKTFCNVLFTYILTHKVLMN